MPGVYGIIMFFFLAGLFFGPIQALGNQYNQALTAMAGAERLFRLLDTKPEWDDAPDANPLPTIRRHGWSSAG
jgi:ATP-binding cassette subfamily B protein